jgi:hypothetical protein
MDDGIETRHNALLNVIGPLQRMHAARISFEQPKIKRKRDTDE